jgi:ketosteroid isomerase-like protein
MTTTPLPEPIAAYRRAQDAGANDAIVACFTDDAEVIDEAVTRRGRAAIRQWRAEVATKYEYTVELLGVQVAEDGRYVVRTRLEGNFPGGVAYLANRFTLRDGRIQALEIAT